MSRESITWHNDRTPKSERFDDIYFSPKNGLEESRYVFLQHNRLPERFNENLAFSIGEIGFGTGLNFFQTWLAWRDCGAPCYLEFVSFEKYPLRSNDISKALAPWPELTPLVNAFLAQYRLIWPGVHTMNFEQGRLRLSLHIGDASESLQQFCGKIDAWYLDGFAPKKNPELWSADLFESIASHTRPLGTFATFTAASHVQKGLQSAGFNVYKNKGYAHKREMLVGDLPTIKPETLPPWFALPNTATTTKTVAVIGAGLAGASAANALAKAGFEVSVYEKNHIASAASGNPAGLFQPQLSLDHSPASRFYLSAFSTFLRWLTESTLGNEHFEIGGITHPAKNPKASQRYQSLADKFAGFENLVSFHQDALHFPLAGWINPKAWSEHLLNHPNINVYEQSTVETLEQTQGGWRVNQEEFDICIAANAFDAQRFIPFFAEDILRVPGQLNIHPAHKRSAPERPMSFGHYVIPNANEQLILGASFELNGDVDTQLQPAIFKENLEALSAINPTLGAELLNDPLDGRRSNRCVSKDHLPIVGPIPNIPFYKDAYHDLRHGKHWKHYPVAAYLPNLYVSTAHGARGIVSSALAADLICCMVKNQSLSIDSQVYANIHPARSLLRTLKKRNA